MNEESYEEQEVYPRDPRPYLHEFTKSVKNHDDEKVKELLLNGIPSEVDDDDLKQIVSHSVILPRNPINTSPL